VVEGRESIVVWGKQEEWNLVIVVTENSLGPFLHVFIMNELYHLRVTSKLMEHGLASNHHAPLPETQAL
jgi:hypothetical protein